MSKAVGLIGCGKIGRSVLAALSEPEAPPLSFIRLRNRKDMTCGTNAPVIDRFDKERYQQTGLIIECAGAEALRELGGEALQYADLMPFSLTALADENCMDRLCAAARASGHRIYIPHGAAAGIDGIRGGRGQLRSVRIETVKSPQTLGRNDTVRTVVFTGSTREACRQYPKNVNIHAAAALAGMGFDKTVSVIISDPGAETNSHDLTVEGQGFTFRLHITSHAGTGVSGAYTLLSAVQSLKEAAGRSDIFRFI